MTGVRRVLDNAADRAIGSPHAEALYLAGLCAASAASWLLLRLARALSP